jgi:hypothetical protein
MRAEGGTGSADRNRGKRVDNPLTGHPWARSTRSVRDLLPVVAVALGVLVLDERASWHLLAGTAVVALIHRRPPLPS